MNAYPGVWRKFIGPVQKWEMEKKKVGTFSWNNALITSSWLDERGNVIVGTLGAGIFWSDANGKWQNISTEQGLSSAYVLSLCMDSGKNLWAGTDGGGLGRIKRKIFNPPTELPSKDAQSLSADADEGFWAAFNAAGISHWNQNNATENYSIGLASNAWAVLVTKR